MIRGANLAKEVNVTAKNKIGLLAEVSKLVAAHDINIDGLAGYAMDGDARIMMVTQDTTRAVEMLYKAGFTAVKETEVIILELENKSGALKTVAEKLAAEGIDIKYAYGTACGGSCPPKLVLATTDNQKALVAFRK